MGVLRMAVVVLCALQITSVKCHRPHNSNVQGEKSINNFNNGICTLVDGSVATIHFPAENELDCHAIGTILFCMISRLDLQKEANMPWSIISNMLGAKKCLVPQHWLPKDAEDDGCFHDETAHDVYAGLKYAPNDEVMLALWDWGCENHVKVDAALETVFAEGLMGAEQLGTAWTGMMTGQQMATTSDPNRCTPNIQDTSFQQPIVDLYNAMHDNQNGFDIDVNGRSADGTWTLKDGTVITPLKLNFIDVPPPTTSPTLSPTTDSPSLAPTTSAPTEAPTDSPTVTPVVFSAGHVTKSGAIVTLAVAAVLARLANY